jgi:hypothetical protein
MTLQRSTDPLVWIDCEVNHTQVFHAVVLHKLVFVLGHTLTRLRLIAASPLFASLPVANNSIGLLFGLTDPPL